MKIITRRPNTNYVIYSPLQQIFPPVPHLSPIAVPLIVISIHLLGLMQATLILHFAYVSERAGT